MVFQAKGTAVAEADKEEENAVCSRTGKPKGRAVRLERPLTGVLGGHRAVPHETLLEGDQQPG